MYLRKSENTIGDRLRGLREREGLTQQSLAKEFQLAHGGVISMYEKNKRQLSPELLIEYSKRFAVSTDWILKGD